MEYRYIGDNMAYDGTQLRSHWIYDKTEVLGDAVVAFSGPADVPIKNMVDLADVKNNAPIASSSMLHLIAEHFSMDLSSAILSQRLLCAIVFEELCRRIDNHSIERKNDDIFDKDKKLSVSIATASPISCLIHFGINIKSDKTPVPAKGLEDYMINPRRFAEDVMKRYADEMKSLYTARCKVRSVT